MNEELTSAQNQLLEWIKDYINSYNYSPSIRQMMKGMGLKSPAPIQSRLKHLQEKGYISWQEGRARTLQLINELENNIYLKYKALLPKYISLNDPKALEN